MLRVPWQGSCLVVIIKSSNKHFDVSEWVCLGCGSAEHLCLIWSTPQEWDSGFECKAGEGSFMCAKRTHETCRARVKMLRWERLNQAETGTAQHKRWGGVVVGIIESQGSWCGKGPLEAIWMLWWSVREEIRETEECLRRRHAQAAVPVLYG